MRTTNLFKKETAVVLCRHAGEREGLKSAGDAVKKYPGPEGLGWANKICEAKKMRLRQPNLRSLK